MKDMSKFKNIILYIVILMVTSLVNAEEHEVLQENKAFSVNEISIKAGDSISFKNGDDFYHNVFSLSDAAMFDLGSYEQGKAKSIVFEEEGIVEIECAIHPSMKMTVKVK